MKIAFVLILTWFTFNPHVANSQIKLATGLYKLEDSGKYKLTLNGKIYHTDGEPIDKINNMKKFNVTQNSIRKDFYNLNFELDAEGIKKLGYAIPFGYGKSTQLGMIIQGELKSVPLWPVPIASKNVSISDKSKIKLDQIADELRVEKSNKL